MGAAARRRAEAHAIDRIARRYVEFFDATARAAERAWTGPVATRPLVDLDAVIAAQATRPLALDDKVRLGDTARRPAGHPGPAPRAARAPRAAARRLRGQGPPHRRRAGRRRRPPPGAAAGEASGHDDLAATSRFLVRLLNFGVLELA